jgi:hypothetical protein
MRPKQKSKSNDDVEAVRVFDQAKDSNDEVIPFDEAIEEIESEPTARLTWQDR